MSCPSTMTMVGPFRQTLGRPEEKAEYLGACFEHQFAPTMPNYWDFEEEVCNEVDDYIAFLITGVQNLFPGKRSQISSLNFRQGRPLARLEIVTMHCCIFINREFGFWSLCLTCISYFQRKWRKTTVIIIRKQGKIPFEQMASIDKSHASHIKCFECLV